MMITAREIERLRAELPAGKETFDAVTVGKLLALIVVLQERLWAIAAIANKGYEE